MTDSTTPTAELPSIDGSSGPNSVQFAQQIGVPFGTVKRWLKEGLPCIRGTRKGRRSVAIDPEAAKTWLEANRPKSVSFDRSSVVYFVRREDGLIKIGWTSDLARRLYDLAKLTKQGVQIVLAMPGNKKDELKLHSRFASSRVVDEWFAPSKQLVDFIDTYALSKSERVTRFERAPFPLATENSATELHPHVHKRTSKNRANRSQDQVQSATRDHNWEHVADTAAVHRENKPDEVVECKLGNLASTEPNP